ncbi:MAG: sigma-54-dependent transcriptional regulator [Bradymonadia bacterium]
MGTLKPTALLVDDDTFLCELISRWLARAGYAVEVHHDGSSMLNALGWTLPDVICLDLGLPDADGLELLERLRRQNPTLPIIILTADDTVDSVVRAMQSGAYDYLPKPVDETKLLTAVRNAVDHHKLATRLADLEAQDRTTYRGIHGASAIMRSLFKTIERVAARDVSILIHGESGSGKELVARALHEASGRRDGPFVAVNCAAFPPSLIEAELFGHEKGAFTGATHRRAGCFERADGGTIFLDEVAELDLSVQAKLLRVLQERAFCRVGGVKEIRSDFRLLTATHKHLSQAVVAGEFREDLFYRVAVFEMQVPSLKDRVEDVALLAHHFLEQFSLHDQTEPLRLSAEALEALKRYPWPGNVRELQNAIQHAAVMSSGGTITLKDLPHRVRGLSSGLGTVITPSPLPAEPSHTPLPATTLEEIERQAIIEALDRHRGNVSAAQRQLGIGRTTLYRKMKKFNIELDRG